ncbi:hypothetical protein [Candidatus Poriferisodalis sp.]|uniref:hypothetical protein n=1 Tax=Candidatus Poriferisodalis sp. TaxID=3101277 RepID=UPI003C6FBD93
MKILLVAALVLFAAGCSASTHADYLEAADGDDLRMAAYEFLNDVYIELDAKHHEMGTIDCTRDTGCVESVGQMLTELCDTITADDDVDADDVAWDLVERNYPGLSKRDADPIAEVLTFTGSMLANGDSDWARDRTEWCSTGSEDDSP